MAEEANNIVSPYLRRGLQTRGMMRGMLICLTLTALHFALRYDFAFVGRYALALALGAAIECLYGLLKDGVCRRPRESTLVTSALLVLSVPARMPAAEVAAGVLVAVLFGKLMVDRTALRLNPMLLGRLFMMLLFADSIQRWAVPGPAVEALTSATPLGLYAAEDFAFSPVRLWLGSIQGKWEGVLAIVPGSPGEVMPLLALVCGVALYFLGVLDWRPSIGFLAGFSGICLVLGMPLGFHLAAGSTVFTAAYIVTDPRSMPGSRSGRLVAGALAGVINAGVRHHGYYPEGVVFAVLAANLVSPMLDRLAFHWRGRQLARRAS